MLGQSVPPREPIFHFHLFLIYGFWKWNQIQPRNNKRAMEINSRLWLARNTYREFGWSLFLVLATHTCSFLQTFFRSSRQVLAYRFQSNKNYCHVYQISLIRKELFWLLWSPKYSKRQAYEEGWPKRKEITNPHLNLPHN